MFLCDGGTLMIWNRAASKFRCAYIQQQSLYRKTTHIHQMYFPPTNKGIRIGSSIFTIRILSTKNKALKIKVVVFELPMLERSHYNYKRLFENLLIYSMQMSHVPLAAAK